MAAAAEEEEEGEEELTSGIIGPDASNGDCSAMSPPSKASMITFVELLYTVSLLLR